MDEGTKQEIFTRLDAIAEKLGVAVGHLWEVLVRQAYVEAGISLVWILTTVAVFSLLAWYWTKKFPQLTEDSYDNTDLWAGSVTLSVVVFIIGVICLDTGIPMVLTGLLNPEYFALKEVLRVAGQ